MMKLLFNYFVCFATCQLRSILEGFTSETSDPEVMDCSPNGKDIW